MWVIYTSEEWSGRSWDALLYLIDLKTPDIYRVKEALQKHIDAMFAFHVSLVA